MATDHQDVHAEMEAMGIQEQQAELIYNLLINTATARCAANVPARAIAAELLYLWAMGLAKAAETVYLQTAGDTKMTSQPIPNLPTNRPDCQHDAGTFSTIASNGTVSNHCRLCGELIEEAR